MSESGTTSSPIEGLPLVEVDVAGLPFEEGMELVYNRLIVSAERGRPFAAVVTMPATMAQFDMFSGYRQRMSMALNLRSKMKGSCRGIAFVSPPRIYSANSRLTRLILGFWGFPTMITDSLDVAQQWACERIVE